MFHVKQSPRHDDRRRFRERCRPQRRMFHVKQLRSSATRHPHPQQRGTRTRAITPNTHTRRSTADTKRGATPRQHPAQSVTNAHTWAPLTHSPAPQLHEGARAPDADAPHKRTQTPHTNGRTGPSGPRAPKPSSPRNPQALTPASRALSARGPRASARRPRRAQSTR